MLSELFQGDGKFSRYGSQECSLQLTKLLCGCTIFFHGTFLVSIDLTFKKQRQPIKCNGLFLRKQYRGLLRNADGYCQVELALLLKPEFESLLPRHNDRSTDGDTARPEAWAIMVETVEEREIVSSSRLVSHRPQ